ncbi:MAG: IS30 family transposase [Anaerotignum sp.]|nr:IS30 family transposase [Anaerotignum sp.]
MSKHLTLSDRSIIEKYIALDMSFAYIARRLNRSATTISREVKNHRCFVNGIRYTSNDCISYRTCLKRNLCSTETKYTCFNRCKVCTEYSCSDLCPDYISAHCPLLDKPPYVCTCCPEEKKCQRSHAYYTAHRAHADYVKQRSTSRKGIRTSPERLMELNDLLMPLIAKGQSINHIFASHADEIGLSEKTIYNYIDMNAFHIRNIDLPKKVRYRQRHPHEIVMKRDYQYRKGRSYTDFISFVEQNQKLAIWEMDTVKGSRGSQQVLLTMILRDTNFMLIFLLPDGTQKSVLTVFDKLTLLLGIETFRRIFPVILTDNGVEFKGSHHLEFTENGARRTRIFYCDPQASWQKGRIEKNHVLLRQILPKGTSFRTLEDSDIHLITCHVNSVVRELFDNNTPFDLMQKEEHKKLLATLALSPIPPDEVCLKPKLLKRKK